MGRKKKPRFNKYGHVLIKRKDLPKCPICGSEAFLEHDRLGIGYAMNFPEGSIERQAFENYFKNNELDYIEAGYSCGCKRYRPGDGIHNEPMAVGIKTRDYAIKWWLRKVDEINGRNKV